MKIKDKVIQPLFKQAKQAMNRAYSPYSHVKVGATVYMSNGKSYSGCNIENSSYGGTICAERVAIFKAISENDTPLEIKKVVIVTDATPPWPPCGICRQVIAEFSSKNTEIHLVNLEGAHKKFSFEQLLPQAFKPKNLLKKKK